MNWIFSKSSLQSRIIGYPHEKCLNIWHISGWWYTYPCEQKWVRHLGWLHSHIYGKIKKKFQTINQLQICTICNDTLKCHVARYCSKSLCFWGKNLEYITYTYIFIYITYIYIYLGGSSPCSLLISKQNQHMSRVKARLHRLRVHSPLPGEPRTVRLVTPSYNLVLIVIYIYIYG